ncbi:hypothetical protein NA57DRAFT_77086 [Rhizodiscina lignyota]|uniref:ASST-domain-containing protein n=1 Tax=Rhizodiscina lignyota TaxID=1504668 RepID=A0A9P4IGZ4_9PEZI|nr:hypothetical protein NA57DRAFT_77086 [Rhizodiscina lignyota]
MVWAMLAVVVAASAVIARADQQAPYADNPGYEKGAFGPYPNQTFVSNPNVTAPVFNIITPAANGVANADYLFLGPKGDPVKRQRPTIVNATDLSIMWADTGNITGEPLDVRVQSYNGKDYITFFSGSDGGSGYGGGYYYMLDDKYSLAYNLSAQNISVLGDFHEFQLTDNGTALITVYEPMPFNLSIIDSDLTNGFIVDSLFQELDIETGKLVFQWRASDHYQLNATYNPLGVTGKRENAGFDWFHINSVQKDQTGNYLVSSRHLHTVTYIEGQSGDIIWILGGKLNQFKDLSGGNATNFAWQHNARWTNDSLTGLTIFDNGASGFNTTRPYTRGLLLNIDQDAKTVQLVQEYLNPERISSISQGNVQLLPNKNVLMGYGANPAVTEYAADGTVLWDIQFGIWNDTDVQSYRAYKMNWTSTPNTKPALAQTFPPQRNGSRDLFVSWAGSTEVRGWAVLGGNSTAMLSNSTQNLFNVTKSGFETSITLNRTYHYVRCAALSSNGTVIGATDTLNLLNNSLVSTNSTVDLKPPPPPPPPSSSRTPSASSTSAAPASSSSGGGERNLEPPWKETWAGSTMLGIVGLAMWILA